jgi:hypothetical protein
MLVSSCNIISILFFTLHPMLIYLRFPGIFERVRVLRVDLV